MQHEGKLWPSVNDRQPKRANYHVPRSPLGAEEYVPGSAKFTVTEKPVDRETRLKRQFPLYRLAKFGQKLMRHGAEHEV